MNTLKALAQFGQAPWLDNLGRELIDSGALQRLVEEDGIKGVTSNPAIFEKSIGHSDRYDGDIAALVKSGCTDVAEIFHKLAVTDAKAACNILRPVYETTHGVDGYVSLEVSPGLAHETEATIAEARRIWEDMAEPNLMVKVPATAEGIPAIEKLISEGINVNVTLLFAKDIYVRAAEAYIAGLEQLPADFDLPRMASVASFFVSRIDTAIDGQLQKLIEASPDARKEKLQALLGKAAIANAKLAYKEYQRLFSGKRWNTLAARGARPQRLLWASTGTKNPAYPDTLYADALIGPDTVNTMPPDTMTAFREHGRIADALLQNMDEAQSTMTELASAGIQLEPVTDGLLIDGVDKFCAAAKSLYAIIAKKAEALSTTGPRAPA